MVFYVGFIVFSRVFCGCILFYMGVIRLYMRVTGFSRFLQCFRGFCSVVYSGCPKCYNML